MKRAADLNQRERRAIRRTASLDQHWSLMRADWFKAGDDARRRMMRLIARETPPLAMTQQEWDTLSAMAGIAAAEMAQRHDAEYDQRHEMAAIAELVAKVPAAAPGVPSPVSLADIPPAEPEAPAPVRAATEPRAPRRWLVLFEAVAPWLLAAIAVAAVMRLCAALVSLGGE